MSLLLAEHDNAGDHPRNISHPETLCGLPRLIDRVPRIGKVLAGVATGASALLISTHMALAAPITFSFDVSGLSSSSVSLSNVSTDADYDDPTVVLPGSIASFVLDLAGPTMSTFTSFIFTPDVNPFANQVESTDTGDIGLFLDISLSDGGGAIGMTTAALTGNYEIGHSNVGGINSGTITATAPTPVMITIGGVAFSIEIVTIDNFADPPLGPGLTPAQLAQEVEAKITLLSLAELSVDPDPLDFGKVRIGTSGTETLTVENTGDPGTLLIGTFGGASAPFAPAGTEGFSLGDGETADRDYEFIPTAHGPETTDLAVNSNADDEMVTLQGVGVGPEFSAASMVDFGLVEIGDMTQMDLDISNISTDMGDLMLVGLTLVDLEIIGVDALFFDIMNELDLVGDVIDVGEMLTAVLKFMPTEMTPRLYEAQLKITTDQNAAFGGMGDMFLVDLSGLSFKDDPPIGVSEPLPIAIFTIGLMTIALGRRQRTRMSSVSTKVV